VEGQRSSPQYIHRIVRTHEDAIVAIFSAARDHLLVSLRKQEGQNHRTGVTVGGVTAWIGGTIDKVHDRAALVDFVIGGHVEVVRAGDACNAWLGLKRMRVAVCAGSRAASRKAVVLAEHIRSMRSSDRRPVIKIVSPVALHNDMILDDRNRNLKDAVTKRSGKEAPIL
jgi:hypothetical protein